MNNEQTADLGMNRTGTMMSPVDSIKTAKGAIKLTQPLSKGDATAFANNRISYMKETDTVGSVPLPSSLKGAMASLKEKLKTGDHVFVDKLGERIAFERTGTRLYEALLSKYNGHKDKSSLPPFEKLEQFYLEELKHFQIASEVMKEIGGDPTAVTPAADVAGVAGMGWVQVICDPRTTFKQSLEMILQAELVDNASWEVLVELSDSLGLNKITERFREALEEEAIHLASVKQWVLGLNLNNQAIYGMKESQIRH